MSRGGCFGGWWGRWDALVRFYRPGNAPETPTDGNITSETVGVSGALRSDCGTEPTTRQNGLLMRSRDCGCRAQVRRDGFDHDQHLCLGHSALNLVEAFVNPVHSLMHTVQKDPSRCHAATPTES